jgi:hypothetical protein
MKVAKHYRAYQNTIQICVCIIVFGLVVLFRGRSDKVIWSRFLPASFVGGIFLWLIGKAMPKRTTPKTGNTIHREILKSPIGIKTCPYCGAEYAIDMIKCPADQTILVLK